MSAKTVIAIKEVDGKTYHLLSGEKNDSSNNACAKCVACSTHVTDGLCGELGEDCTERTQSYWVRHEATATKYFVGRLFERNGEYEYTQTVFFTSKSVKQAEKDLARIAKTQYGHDREKDGDGWYFNCGEVYVEPREFKEISKATYDELKGFH